MIVGAGDTAYADRIGTDDGINWQVFRPGEALRDPDTGEVLGYEANYVGDARVKRFGTPDARSRSPGAGRRSTAATGSRRPASRPSRPTSRAPRTSRSTARSCRSNGGVSEFGQYSDRDDQPRLARRHGSRPRARDDAQGRRRLPHAFRTSAARCRPVPQLRQPEFRGHAQSRREGHGGRGRRPRSRRPWPQPGRSGPTSCPTSAAAWCSCSARSRRLSYGMILKAVRPISVGDVVQTP